MSYQEKTIITDSAGNAVTVTGNKLDVNASVDTTGLRLEAGHGSAITDPSYTIDANKQSVLYYAQVLTASDTLTPTAGKKIKLLKMQVLQNPDNSAANKITLNFTSTGDFFVGWVGSDSSEVIGATDEVLNINLTNSQSVSVMLRYKEIS